MSRRKLYVRLLVSILKRREDESDFLSTVPEQYRWPWIGLIAAAGDSPAPGKVCIQEGIPFTDEQLSKLLDTEHLKAALKCFEKLDMIFYDKNRIIVIKHWEIYQTEWERLQKYLTDKDIPKKAPKHLPTPLPTDLPYSDAVILPSITLSTKDSSKDFSIYMQKWNFDEWRTPIKSLEGKRKKNLQTRLNEKGFDFDEIIKYANISGEFLKTGKWFTFDWIVKNDTNWRKVIEGNYIDKDAKATPGEPPKVSPEEARARSRREMEQAAAEREAQNAK